ncbi:MAG: esterase-like activity of phytase family protein [Myxococcota bacterium]|nr:esterase-like activity of phytase family protein [Myxococcota bacterium]
MDTATGSVLEGVSGLARHADGSLWLSPERQRALIRQDPSGTSMQIYPLEGVPEGLDTESIAWLPDGRLALGTERVAHRGEDPILFARIEGERVVVEEETLSFSYAPWGLTAQPNRGLEGLTLAGDWLIALSEMDPEDAGERRAPLGAYNLKESRWEHTLVSLTSPTGRMSAIDCVLTDGGALHCLAIERHYGVSRVLSFHLHFPLAPVTNPACVQNLTPHIGGRTNMEGVLQGSAGTGLLVNDNSSDPKTVPTALYAYEHAKATQCPD